MDNNISVLTEGSTLPDQSESFKTNLENLINSPFIELLIILKYKDISAKDPAINKLFMPLINRIVNNGPTASLADDEFERKVDALIPILIQNCKGKDILLLITTMLEVIDARLK